MIFVDSNVPMYLVGADHPNKQRSKAALERLSIAGERLVTDVEVFQEILHRYLAVGRQDAIDLAFETLLGLADEVFSITLEDALRARRLVSGPARISARDAVHVAVMERNNVERILTFDSGFDDVPGLVRET